MYGLMNTQKYEHANLPHIIIEYTTHMYLGLCTRRSVEYVQAFTIEVFADICCKNKMNLPKVIHENYCLELNKTQNNKIDKKYSYINNLSHNCKYPFQYRQ